MDEPRRGYESSDVSVRKVLLFGAGLIAAAAVIHLTVAGVLVLVSPDAGEAGDRAAAARTLTPPEPRLQVDPERDLEALRAREERRLGSYGWVDRPSGIVRIPVDRAVELVLERGVPTWK